jgi:uncharacterized delta-60 repeat protein
MHRSSRACLMLAAVALVPAAQAALNVTISTGTTTGGSFASGIWTPTASPSRINVNDLIAQLNAGNVTIRTNAAGAEAGNITIANTLTLSSITPTTGRTLTLNAENDILINAALNQTGGSPKPVNLVLNANSDSAGGGSITLAADVQTGGGNFTATGVNLTQNASQNLDAFGGNLTLNLTGAFNFAGNAVTTSGGNLSLTAVTSSSTSASLTTSGGNINATLTGSGAVLTAGSLFNAGGGAGTGSIDLRSNSGSLTLSAAAFCSAGGSGSVTLRAATGMTLSGDVSSPGSSVDIRVTGTGELFMNSTSQISVLGGGNSGSILVIVNNGNVSLASGSLLRSGAAGSVSVSNTGSTNDFTAGGTITGGTGGVTLSSRRDLLHTGATSSTGAFNLTADGDNNSTGAATINGTLTGPGTMLLRGHTFELVSTGAVNTSGGNATLQARSTLILTGDVTTSGGNLQVQASTAVAGTLTIDAACALLAQGGAGAGSVTVTNSAGNISHAGEMRSGGSGRLFIQAIGASSSVTQSGILVAGNDAQGLTIRADNGITISQAASATGRITLSADFDSNGSGTCQINQALAGDGGVTLLGAAITGTASGTLTAQNQSILITSGTGAVTLVALIDSNGGNVSLNGATTLSLGSSALTSDGGTVNLSAASGMTLTGPIQTFGGSFTAQVTSAGTLSLQNDVTTSGGNATLTTANGLLQTTSGSDVNAGGGAGTAAVNLTSLNGIQDLAVGGAVVGGSGGTVLRAGNHVSIAGAVTSMGGLLTLDADSNLGGVGNLTLSVPVQVTGSGGVLATGINLIQSGTGTLTTGGGAINGTFQSNVTFSRSVSSNGGLIRFTANAITVSALLSTAPPSGGTGVLHASNAVVINTVPVLGNADIILLAGSVSAPSIANTTVGAVTTTSARLGGNVTSDGGMPILERGVVFSPTSFNANPLIGGTAVIKLTAAGALGVFTTNASSLSLATAYTFKAFATNHLGTTYTSPVSSFTTSATLTGLADSYDAGIIGGAGAFVSCLALQPDDKAIMAGAFTSAFATPRSNLARFQTNGTVDTGFVANTNSNVESVVVQPDGKILIGGNFTLVNGTVCNGLARLNADGSVESTATFNPGTGVTGSISAMALQPDGKIVIAGFFTAVNGQPRSHIARLHSDGSLESTATFNPGTGVSGTGVFTLALQSDGKILLGGLFNSVDGNARSNIARLNSNGSVESIATFNIGSGAAGVVNEILVQPDNKILVAGNFSSFNAASRVNLARLNSNGSTESTTTFNPGTGPDSTVTTMALQADGKILIGGFFTNVNGAARAHLARLNANGGVESLTTFNTGSGPSGVVQGLALQANGKILIGGEFTQVNGSSRARQARLNNDGITVTLTAPNATQARLLRSGAAPEIAPPRFELSTNNGATWTDLGLATRITGGWEVSNLTLPAGGLLRAAGTSRGGRYGGGSSWIVAAQNFFLPSIMVRGKAVDIPNGSTTTSQTNDTDFAQVLTPGVYAAEHTFRIHNTGGATLTLTGVPRILVSGPAAADFRVVAQPSATSITAGNSVPFTVRFNPSAPGLRTATLSIASNDLANTPHTFTVSGLGGIGALLSQRIVLTAPASVFVNEGAVSLQAYATSGLPVSLSVLSGPATLNGQLLTPTGVGTVRIQATQAGDALHRPAKPVIRTLFVKAQPSVPTLIQLTHLFDGSPKEAGVTGHSGTPVFTYRIAGVDTAQAPAAAGIYPLKVEVDGRTLKGRLIIRKAILFARPQDQRRFVGRPNPVFSIGYTGFQGADNETTVFTAAGARVPVATTAASPRSPGGLYPIRAARGLLPNYSFVYLPGYLMVETFAGKYEALFTNGISNEALGKVEITVSSANKSFTGRVAWMDEATSFAISGALTPVAGIEAVQGGSGEIVRGSTIYAVDFQLPFDQDFPANFYLNNIPNSIASANDGKKLYALPRGQRIGFEGRHTCLLNPGSPQGVGVPAGYGHATAIINSKGSLRLVGQLGDARRFTASLPTDEWAGYRLFLQPYRRAASYLGGRIDLESHPALLGRRYQPLGSGGLTWSKAAGATDAAYRSGFGPLTVSFRLDPWLPPTTTLPLGTLLALTGGNQISVQHAGFASDLFSSLPTALELLPDRKVTVTSPTNPTPWKIRLNAATGSFSGSFTLRDAIAAPSASDPSATRTVSRAIPFFGVLRQPHFTAGDPVVGAGQAQITALPTAATNEKLSGSVLMTP